MTWIRWDITTPRSEVVGFLADRLGVGLAQALGHYNALCCGFGGDRRDGRVDKVTDATLEGWALWRGKSGRLAMAIREWCAQNEADPGKLRGWWRNEAVLREQERSARKPDGRKPRNPRQLPDKSPRGSSGDSPVKPRGNDDDNVDELRTTSSSSAGTIPAVQVAVAANRGLQANPGLPGFNELLPQQADQAVKDWTAEGIPLALICSVVEKRCADYKPGLNGSQPSSFAYFDKAVRQAHQQGIGKLQLASAPESPAAKKPSRLKDLTEDLSV